MSKIEIYTDGACKGNPGRGGWAYIILEDEKIIAQKQGGPKEDTTNNRMELTAVIEGIKNLENSENKQINIYSDSAYIVNCFKQSWYLKWQKNGWKGGTNGTIQNQDLWKELIDLKEKNNIEFIYVKGHSGNEFNELADSYASSFADRNK